MSAKINADKLNAAIKQALLHLSKSPRGRIAACDVKQLMVNGAGLDSENGHAVCVLILAALKEGKRDFLSDIDNQHFGFPE